jgi:uncharacterized protein YfaS (alpha-2-macroglobulin family)
MADYLKASGELKPDMTVAVYLDGKLKHEVTINRDNLFTVDNTVLVSGADVSDGSHQVEIRRSGQGPVYYNVYLTNFTLEDPITKAGLELRVERKFYKLVPVEKSIKAEGSRGQVLDQRVEKYQRVELASGDPVVSGDLIEVELLMESKNDYEYIMFEDAKAAGMEAVDVQSGYVRSGMPAYMELRDTRVVFFVAQLARGRHSLIYRLRAEVPGRFSALPAQGLAMYAPELRGNSDEHKVQITDK